jgi:hypothetical protein
MRENVNGILNGASVTSRSDCSVNGNACALKKRSWSERSWKPSEKGSVWRESVGRENVMSFRSSGVWKPCVLRSSSVHGSDHTMGHGGRMITGTVTTSEPTMTAHGAGLGLVAMTTVIGAALMIARDNRATTTGPRGLQEGSGVMIAAADIAMPQQEPAMEDHQVGPVGDPDHHEMTTEEDHHQEPVLGHLQTDLTGSVRNLWF